MDKLWAPWRSKYIYLRKHKKCIFCVKSSAGNDARRYIIERSGHSFSILNLYPYNNGHIMVAPYRHVKSLDVLSDEEMTDVMRLVNRTKKALDAKLKPDGYNIGLNIGRTGGAGYAGHVHIHIVPRWDGDTNFMPVTAGTKIVSESLDVMYALMKAE